MGEGEENGWFYDYRSQDSDWAFRRYQDRLAFTKGVEREVNCIIVEPNFFFSIGQTSRFQQRLIMQMMEKLNMPLVSITGTFDSLRYHHLYHSLLDLDGSSFATVGPSDLNFKLQLNLTFASSINSVVTVVISLGSRNPLSFRLRSMSRWTRLISLSLLKKSTIEQAVWIIGTSSCIRFTTCCWIAPLC